MICNNCEKYERILKGEQISIKYGKSDEFNKLLIDYSVLTNNTNCSNCGTELFINEPVIESEKDFFAEFFSILGKIGSELIENCQHCSGQTEMKYAIERNYNEKNNEDILMREQLVNHITDGMDVSEFIGEYFELDLLEDEETDIAHELVCKYCKHGNGPDYSDGTDYALFERYEEIYTKSHNDEYHHTFFGDDVPTYLSILAETMSIDDLITLRENFKESRHYDRLEFQNLKTIIESVFNGNEPISKVLLASGRYCFHGRKHNKSDSEHHKTHLWRPKFGYSSHGRYSQVGCPEFYLSNSYLVLPDELRKSDQETITVGSFEVNRDKYLLPVDELFSDCDYYKMISESPDESDNAQVKKEYIMTNIIYIIAKNTGFDGIVYKSIKNNLYTNYIIFDIDEESDAEIITTFEIE